MNNKAASSKVVFISYARKDSNIVSVALSLLQAGGAQTFIDVTDVNYGDKWEEVLLDNVSQCERMLVFWSASAAASKWVDREWRTADRLEKRIVPVPLDNTALPDRLSQYQSMPKIKEFLDADRLKQYQSIYKIKDLLDASNSLNELHSHRFLSLYNFSIHTISLLKITSRNEYIQRNEHGRLSKRSRLKQLNQLADRLKRNQPEDRLKRNQPEDRLKRNQLEDRFKRNQLEDRLKRNQLEDRLKRNQLEDRLKRNQLEDRLKRNQLEDRLKRNQLADRLKRNQLADRLKRNQQRIRGREFVRVLFDET